MENPEKKTVLFVKKDVTRAPIYKEQMSFTKSVNIYAQKPINPPVVNTAPVQNTQAHHMTSRQPKAMVSCAMQGGGKTYTTIKELGIYQHKYKRPVLIVDINGEYTQYKAVYYDARIADRRKRAMGNPKSGRMGIAGIKLPRIYRIVGIRPDNVPMSEAELIELIYTITDYYTNGVLILEEMNTYIRRQVPRGFYAFMIRLRHKGVDLIMHYQSIGDAHPDIWRQTKVLRLHRTMDSVRSIEDKIPNFELTRIAELAIEKHYLTGKADNTGKYYFLYIDFENMKILGISEQDFRDSCERYLYQQGREVRDIMQEEDQTGRRKFKTKRDAINKLIDDKMIYMT
jgi:hypothetical protein